MASDLQRGIVRGPRSPSKQELAKQMRREMTEAENALWQALRRNQLLNSHWRRQQVIDGFIADFYCHATGLIVEADGNIHETQQDHDALRASLIAARTIRFLRFSNDQILQNLPGVLRAIGASLTPQPPSPIRSFLTGKGEDEAY